MPNGNVSHKKIQIDQASRRVIIATSVAAFVVVFCAVASQALLSQLLYQNRIVSAKKTALSQLKKDKDAVNSLNTSYNTFVASSPNIIGGSSTGSGSQDGDNAKIILDALPSSYDFPALTSSLEKLLSSQNVEIQSITGTDDEVAQAGAKPSGNPQPVAMPFEISAKGDYTSIQNVTKTFEASIRPIQVQTMTVTGDSKGVTLDIVAQTYFQPQKTFSVGQKEIQ